MSTGLSVLAAAAGLVAAGHSTGADRAWTGDDVVLAGGDVYLDCDSDCDDHQSDDGDDGDHKHHRHKHKPARHPRPDPECRPVERAFSRIAAIFGEPSPRPGDVIEALTHPCDDDRY